MKHTKKIRGGFWNNYFRRRDLSQEEINLFTLIKKIREKLICDKDVLEGVSNSRGIFEKNIELYLGVLEEFRAGVETLIKAPDDSNFLKDLNKVNMEERGHLYYGVRPAQDTIKTYTAQDTIKTYKILYAFLILEVKQLRDLQINLKKKLESISGKKSHWFSSMFIRLPDGTTTDNLNNARESLRIKEEIKPIIKKFCNVNIDSFYARFYNYIRKFKLNLSSSDKKKVMKDITDIFGIINKILNEKKNKFPTDSPDNSPDNSYNSPDNSYNSPDNSSDISDNSSDISDNSSLYGLYEKLPNGGKRTKKTGRKKSRKIK